MIKIAYDCPDYYNRYAEREALEGRKRVLLDETFDLPTFPFTTDEYGDGSIERNLEYSKYGNACAYFKAPSDYELYVEMRIFALLTRTDSIRIDVEWAHDCDENGLKFEVFGYYYDYDYISIFGLQHSYKNQMWSIRGSGSSETWSNLQGQFVTGDPNILHNYSLAANIKTGKYLYAILDGIELDLNDYDVYFSTNNNHQAKNLVMIQVQSETDEYESEAYLFRVRVSEL